MANSRTNTLKQNGINTDNYVSLNVNGQTINISIEPHDDLEQNIKASGYVKNNSLHRRWVMAQFFSLLNQAECYGWRGQTVTIDTVINHKYNYKYQFTDLARELNVLSEKLKQNDDTYEVRSKFFTPYVMERLYNDYLTQLEFEIEHEKRYHIHSCRGVDYIRLPHCKLNNGKGVFVNELDKLVEDVKKEMDRSLEAYKEGAIDESLRHLRKLTKMIYIKYDSPLCKAWIDAFKGAGSYYTAENMIMHHNILPYDCNNVEEGLEELKFQLEQNQAIDHTYGYKMYAFLKRLIKDNNFNFIWNSKSDIPLTIYER